MEKEICIYKKVDEICNSTGSLKTKLNNIAKVIYQEYSIKICFCEILGKRWSFYAGLANFSKPQEHIMITDKMGILVENNSIDSATFDIILDIIKRIF